ncbi:hypothetical protein FM112_04040 [Gulosibacter sp. 10]|nr:hypothetical protein FM112_04040 [Gulosibacter sp. 10]
MEDGVVDTELHGSPSRLGTQTTVPNRDWFQTVVRRGIAPGAQ